MNLEAGPSRDSLPLTSRLTKLGTLQHLYIKEVLNTIKRGIMLKDRKTNVKMQLLKFPPVPFIQVSFYSKYFKSSVPFQ